MEFLLSKKEYAAITGRNQGKRDVLAYHLRQSFKPGEVDAETANKIGYELALRFTKGRHSFIVATHVDKAHIHNHIIFNSTNLDCNRKFVNFWGSSKALRKLSDIICMENGLSIIESPKPPKGHYGTWLGDGKEPTAREKLERLIDKILAGKPADLTAFLRMLEAEHCEIKRGKHLSIRMDGQKRFIRLRSLLDDYTEGAIRERITGKRKVQPQTTPPGQERKVNLLIDIQNSIKAQNSPGYERWAKIFNLKQAAQTLLFLQDNGITEITALSETAQKAKDIFNAIQSRINAADSRLKEITALQKHIGAYIKTKDVYAAYRQAGYSKKYLAEHEPAITACKAAKAYFDEKKLDKLPTIKMLQTEYAVLSAEKKKAYGEYHQARKFMQDILTAKQNAEQLLGYQESENARTADRAER